MRFGERDFTYEEHHVPSLERAVLRAFSRGDHKTALQLADRLCRIAPRLDVPHLLLRADALERGGDRAAALADIEAALTLAPENRAANRRLLAWGDAEDARAAAALLLRIDNDLGVLADAIGRLRTEGMDAFGAVSVIDDTVRGWAAWSGTPQIDVRIERPQGHARLTVSADPRHPLKVLQHAASFAIQLADGPPIASVALLHGESTFFSLAIGADMAPTADPSEAHIAPDLPSARLTVIVPVYDDVAATTACLDALCPELEPNDSQLIIVDDASPDPAMGGVLSRIAGHPRVRLLRNPANLGFVGAVNRGLALAPSGDVLLLNADTILPKGGLLRLAMAAHSADGIGTVTPLSNNGEFTSLPLPATANPMPAPEELVRLDQAAHAANAGGVIDMPNGIGFCLYVTRAFLDAVGPLSTDYHRGYLEDVDWCLRGRRAGLRNVCATDVHVGHAGSRSFGKEKRSLVVRNLKVLERRFPQYRAECAAFLAADPLREARRALEVRLPQTQRDACLIVTGPGMVAGVAEARAGQLRGEGQDVVLARLARSRTGTRVRLEDAAGRSPQSIEFDLGVPDGRNAFSEYLTALRLGRIEIADPRSVDSDVLDALGGCGPAPDFLVADAGLVFPRGASPASLSQRPSADVGVAEDGWRTHTGTEPSESVRAWREGWLTHVARAGRLIAPTEDAAAFAADFFSGVPIEHIFLADRACTDTPIDAPASSRPCLGLLPIETSADSYRHLKALCTHLKHLRPELDMVVLGRTSDDLGLMKSDRVFVTGPINAEELADLTARHRITHLLIGPRQPLFGHPLQLAAHALPLPAARFDWTRREEDADNAEMRLSAERDAGDLARQLARWITTPSRLASLQSTHGGRAGDQ